MMKISKRYLIALWTLLPFVFCQDEAGLFPNILNLATRSRITVNATCGEEKSEVFCKLVDHVKIFPSRNSHCDVCNARSPSESQRHPIYNAINGRNSWWQSPTLTNGNKYNYVTITLDLRQVYQVAYVIVKAANAPRPGNWILERSIDGITYQPWQYFGIRNRDCRKSYGMRATKGIPNYLKDDQVICTTKYSKLNPLENGEIFVSLVNGRPGVERPSETLLEFTSARYVRLRLQKIRTLNADLMTFRGSSDLKYIDPYVTRRYFYSIKDISIGGQCICYGHARICKPRSNSDRLYCECQHNTCGNNCEKCCEFYYQKPWQPGTNGLKCERCNCHNHATECVYNATVDALRLSLNMAGEYDGGGVCLGCKDYTTGINCERCIDSYYRPLGESQSSRFPCRPCRCEVTLGSTGQCYMDDSKVKEGKRPGDCVCKEGYGGPLCDECAFGYYGYPYCKPCPCNAAGSINSQECTGNCFCKANVEGQKCDRCKQGFYNLDRDNPDGCTPCFCFGLSGVCQSANLGIIQITDMSGGMAGWSVTSLGPDGFTLFINKNEEGWLVYRAYPSSQNSIEPTAEVTYYWQAPLKYLGNRLTSYGGNLKYKIKYDTDPSVPYQRHMYGIDVLIQSGNLTLINKKSYLREDTLREASVELNETNWFRLEQNGIYDRLKTINKKDFMTLLFNIERLLIRATYHTAQNVVYLRDVTIDAVSPSSNSTKTIKSVEKCSCPRGYQGLSCEECEPGYRRLGNQLYAGKCLPCDCNRHSDSCDTITGKCSTCKHFTTGERCEVCLPGYYGDPHRGTEKDCKPCACPLSVDSNNFATTCQLIPQLGNYDRYRCNSCDIGYTGDRCERCSPGYYGNPTEVGSKCQPCDCGGNINMQDTQSCDVETGECLRCQNNTEGTRCENCRKGYYGTAINGDCTACDCNLDGSVNGTCDKYTGKCTCKEKYFGRRCDQCQPGYGSFEAGCEPCDCDPQGSIGTECNSYTGQCFCHVGIEGKKCDTCKPGFYGFSYRGCIDCNCNRFGTNQTNPCDANTGYCNCLPNVYGSRCDACQENYWGIAGGDGCTPCDCNPIGSNYRQCDRQTGQCPCRAGVDGLHCDKCRQGFYGLSVYGCKRCAPCNKAGHICDEQTGECVCPPLTTGQLCERCQPDTWGYDPVKGCKACGCDPRSSESSQCDLNTGKCTCKADFTGDRCDKCLPGFYNFPACQICLCSADGTEQSSCDSSGVCQCDDTGQCQCKRNVEGRTCSRCKQGAFSLHKENSFGCTECFCFERSNRCNQIPYVRRKIDVPDRSVSFDPRVTNLVTQYHNLYNVIPENTTWTAIPEFLANGPTYWSLPSQFLGDLTLSYNGEIRFTRGYNTDDAFQSARKGFHPDVVIIGNGFRMTHRSNVSWEAQNPHTLTVKLHPTEWEIEGYGKSTRTLLMIVLQNVTALYIKATPDENSRTARLSKLSIDTAQPGNGSTENPALGVEICQCPSRYSGHSCQNPADGYYRLKHNITTDFSQPIKVIGTVVPCNCYGHSNTCDPETGVCQNCQHNTTGAKCNICKPGFYGDATRGSSGDCRPCICPTVENSFSSTCEIRRGQLFCTNCSVGYTGTRCESCSDGFYGNPRESGGRCLPCDCNPEGSVSASCNSRGHCTCLPGISGKKCDVCQARHAVVGGQCVSCDEGCTADLMRELDELHNLTTKVNLTGVIPVPWKRLWSIKNESDLLRNELETIRNAELTDLQLATKTLQKDAEELLSRSRIAKQRGEKSGNDAVLMKKNATEVEADINETYADLQDFVGKLVDIAQNLFHNKSGINVTAALQEVQDILKEIKDRNFTDKLNRALKENMLAEKLKQSIMNMTIHLNTSGTAETCEKIIDVLLDLQKNANRSLKNSEEALGYTVSIQNKINKTEDVLVDVDLRHDTTVKILGDGHQLNIDARRLLNMSRQNMKDIESKASILDRVLPELRKRDNEMRSQLPGTEELVNQAEIHARNLSDFADRLAREFEKTKADAADPLKAALVYGNIVKAVEEAENASKRAIKAAEDSIRIAGVKNITEQVSNSLNRSRELLRHARNTLSKVPGLDKSLAELNGDLSRIEEQQSRISSGLNNINKELSQFPKDLSDRANKASSKVDNTSTQLNKLNTDVKDIESKIKSDMIPKYNQIRDVQFDGIFENIENSIDVVKKNIAGIQGIVGGVESAANRTMNAESKLNDKLKMLRDNIKQARAQAEKVKVSLSSDGKCVRSYQSKSVPGVTNSISFSFKTNNTTNNQVFLLLQKSPQEFMSVEMINARIRFSWNVGAGVGTITSDVVIKSETEFINTIDKWYHVYAKRLGTIGSLEVSKLSDNTPPIRKTAVSPVGRSFLKLDKNSDLYIAGIPSNFSFKPPSFQATANFTGCMNEMYIDELKIGLHNFKTTTPACGGCKNVPVAESSSSDTYHFDGTGYAAKPQVPFYQSTTFYVKLEFKTFWRDAILLFTGNNNTGDFLYIGLQDQRVVLQVYTGGKSYAKIISNLTYNDNKWHTVIMEREELTALLQVDGSDMKFVTAPGSNTGLELKGSPVYFGGVPESYDLKPFLYWGDIKRSGFLGCLRQVEMVYAQQDLLTGDTVGVTSGCPVEGYRTAGFYGDGFAKYTAQPMPLDKGDISLSFRTKQENALLLLAYNTDQTNFYSIAITNGKVEGRFSTNGLPKSIATQETFNDGELHNVAVQKNDTSIKMYVDDMPLLDEIFLINDEIRVTEMYIGGVLFLPPRQVMVSTTQGLDGCISDIIINEKVLNLNAPLQFERADIGRCKLPSTRITLNLEDLNGDKKKTSSPTKPLLPVTKAPTTADQQASTTPPLACVGKPDTQINIYSLIFGNSRNSYGDVIIDPNDLSESFQISFWFRTFFDNGAVFLLSNSNTTEYVAAQLRNGVVTVFWTNNGKVKKFSSAKVVTDGQWHTAVVSKDRRRIKLKVDDDQEMKGQKIKKKLNIVSPLVVGSIKDNVKIHKHMVRHSLRGCMKNFTVNTRNIMIADATRVQGVTSCYFNMEPGVYMEEDSYGVIENSYSVGREMKIQLEFRSHKPNGIILSITDSKIGDLHGVTLELHEGKVKFSVFNKVKFSASSDISTSICDDQWHSVEASLIGNVVKLVVDGKDAVYGSSSNVARNVTTNSALYVGGVPDFAERQIASFNQNSGQPEGFEGCLRNFKIDSVPIDWFNLVEQENIQRTACPY